MGKAAKGDTLVQKAKAALARRAAEQEKKADGYTIKLIPSEGGDVKSIRLPLRMLKYGAASLAAGALLFVGAAGYAVYGTLLNQNSMGEIQELRQVSAIQQEQLLQLSKKANVLQGQLDQLTQMETELRRLSGTAAQDGTADGSEAATAQGGQGGPHVSPSVQNVDEALANLEKGIEKRRASLLELKQQLEAQREELGTVEPLNLGAAITTPSIWPARGEVSSPYGLRWSGSDFHPGIDIANDMGTPICATADGVVTAAGWNDGGYGNMVDIDHGNGVMTRYGHAMQVVVAAGQHVRRGQIIAYMGSTGFSTGPHVHYEVRVGGSPVNPVSYL